MENYHPGIIMIPNGTVFCVQIPKETFVPPKSKETIIIIIIIIMHDGSGKHLFQQLYVAHLDGHGTQDRTRLATSFY